MSTHPHIATSKNSVGHIAIITCSDTRTPANDTSGAFIAQSILENNHTLVSHVIVREDPGLLLQAIDDAVGQKVQIILINGGTGISKRDNTFEAVADVIDSPMPGFGELFRTLSFQEIGAASMLSRAQAGRYKSVLIFSMPGSTNAVKLAMTQLILPQIGHLISEMQK